MSRPRLFRVLFLIALGLCGVGSPTVSGQAPKKRPSTAPTPTPAATVVSTYVVPEVVATVDGTAIRKKEIDTAVEALLTNKGRTLQNVGDDDKKRAYQTVLDSAIVSQLLSTQAANESVPGIEVEKQFTAFRAQYQDQNAFDAELKKSGQTPERLREAIHRQLAQQQWVEHQIADQVKIIPGEVEKFYQAGPPSTFDAPEAIRVSHILVAVRKDAPPEDALDAEKKINDLAIRIKKGESFEDVAKQASEDPRAKTNGGDLGYVTRDRIMPEFAEAAFRLKTNQVSDPVRTPMGYHLIKVADHRAAHTATLDEARDQITAYLTSAKHQTAVSALIQKLRDQAKIEIFLP